MQKERQTQDKHKNLKISVTDDIKKKKFWQLVGDDYLASLRRKRLKELVSPEKSLWSDLR